MRQVMMGLSVLAVLFVSAPAAHASAFAYCDPGNLSNGDPSLSETYHGVYPGPSQGPYAATGGAIWIKTGSADPVAVDFDVNLEFLYSDSANGPFADLVSLNDGTSPALLLLSNHTADDWFLVHSWEASSGESWPGYWGIFAAPSTDNQAWGIPGTDSSGYYFTKVRAWTGNFNSYAAAVAGGASFAETGAFTTHFASELDPNVGDFAAMPAMILRPYLTGDANQDGKVDINDLTVVLAHYNQTGSMWTQGDFNSDGKVDINDLTVVLAHYNQSLGSSGVGAAAVPEPATFGLLAAILPITAGLLGWRRRGQKS
jgi:hypothetical protein